MPTDEKIEQRKYIVWSIVMGLFLGFIVNVFSSIYYGLFIVRDIMWARVDHGQVLWCALVLLALVGYLQFFIADYPHTFEFSRAYAKRYYQYFIYRFWPGKILRVIVGLYLLLFLVVLLGFIYYAFALGVGYIWATVLFIAMVAAAYRRDRMNTKHA